MAHTPSSTSGTTTPSSLNPRDPNSTTTSSSSSYLSYPVSHVTSWLSRRLTDSVSPARTPPHPRTPSHLSLKDTLTTKPASDLYTPPNRTASPFQPPPLTPLTLTAPNQPTPLLTPSLAEEIRLLVPPRLQLSESWSCIYSLDRDGATISTLYHNCSPSSSSHAVPPGSSFVLVVQDALGGTFGAYLTDAPKPGPSFYGTGECFLWRASLVPAVVVGGGLGGLVGLPPPPSASEGEVAVGRSTTIRSPSSPRARREFPRGRDLLTGDDEEEGSGGGGGNEGVGGQAAGDSEGGRESNGNHANGTATPAEQLLRFKAFPYSGVNDYLIFCEPTFLSVGGGDGKYGLWLDGNMERGISGQCMTFGNEALSEEGEKFEIVGVEVWCVGGR